MARGYQTNMDWEKEEGDAYPYYVYGAACSEVEVDCLTGAHKLLRTDIFMDAAFSINPALDIGQVEGAFIQGMGLYTIEELKYSPEGVLYSRSPDDYKIPTVTEIPEEFHVTLVRSRNPIAIYSSKGLGEAGMFMGSSVLFAIYDAVAAARRERGLTKTFTLHSPATPELIRMTCVDQFTDMIHRFQVRLTGTKYACGRGGCGACTVMVSKRDPASEKIRHFSVTACLIPICSLYGAAVTTVEGVGSIKTRLHPVQERIAKSHGTQCGFCTPGMVMSMYTLLRNHPQPSEEQLMAALGGNLCRCTGYWPVLASGKTFCLICTELFAKEEFQPLDPTQELIFPPELLRMTENPEKRTLTFHGERITWISPGTLQELLQLKVKHPGAPLVLGNTSLGLTIGAGCSLAQVEDILAERVSELPEEKTQTFRALLKHLKSLAGQQIRNLAWEFVSAFRQAQCQQNALADMNAAMRVLLKEGSDTIEDLSIAYGGVGAATISAQKSCQQLLGRRWDELMLVEACRLLLDEVSLPGWAPGGKVEFKRTLVVSFFFKFYLEVLQELKKLVKLSSVSGSCRYPEISDRFLSALEDFPVAVPQGVQMYQVSEAIFCDDIPMVDKELFMALVTSTRAHAKIISVDFSEALELPGVVDVVTAEDIPGTNGAEDDKLLAVDKVLCVGQIICAVVAGSDVQAKRAIEKIKITYQDQEPVIFTIQDAIKHNSFLCPEKKLEQGNIEEAFEKVDQIVEGEVHVGGQEHFYMETQRVLVIPKTEDKELDIYVSTQDPAHVQKTVSSTLNIPINRITCHVKRVGGGFGGKVGRPAVFGAIAAVGAIKTGHPIRLVLDREDDMLITGGRHPLFGKYKVSIKDENIKVPYKVGFMNNGRIKALDIECFINGGCTLDHSEQVTEFLILKLENAYKIRNLRLRGRACLTNLPSNTAFRGFGFPQGTLVTESCITAVAAKCGLLPEKVREKNMYRTVDKTIYKQAFSPETLIRCWNECLGKSSFHSRRMQVAEFNKQNYWKKRGIAMIPMKFSVGFAATSYHQAAALVHIYTDGSVLVTHGGNELGQGIHTKMLQVASRELKIPMSYMHICETSTATVPNTIATAASVGSDVNGRAVQIACQILLKRLEPIIKKNPEGTWEDWIEAAFEQRISLSATGYFRGYKAFVDWEKGEGDPFPYYVYGAACSEVEIDCLTGAYKKVRTDIVMDACCSLNPAIDIGQIEGAFIQGMGLYTTEELKYSPEGVLYSRGPDEYKIPTITDVPEEFNVSLLPSSQSPLTIYSSKGLGESGMFLGSSVFFAITDAVAAARRERDIAEDFTVKSPATPEWVRMACADRFTEMAGVAVSSCCGHVYDLRVGWVSFMNNQKQQKPTLSGQRFKTRKRDEKERFDPTQFQDCIIQGLTETGTDLEAVAKFLDASGAKLDYRRYAETLFDILVAGGMLAPGGTLADDMMRTDVCVFAAQEDLETMQAFAQVFNKLIRRYKYLEKGFEDEVKKLLLFLKGFSESERNKLAMLTGVLLANGTLNASILNSLYNENLVKEGVSAAFAVKLFKSWINEKDINAVAASLRKELFPANKQSVEHFTKYFTEAGLKELSEYVRNQQTIGARKELQKELQEQMSRGDPFKDIILYVKEEMKKNNIPEPIVIGIVWSSVMSTVEWNKKEELVAEQAIKHLKQYSPLLAAFTTQGQSELTLLLKIQEYCYDNIHFMKAFQKIVVLFYKAEVLSEEPILKWYKDAHVAKGKSVFLEQMKKFVEWLKNAEEESESEAEEGD
ncbi:aldehyde oxidase 3-like protein [Camelus ferus]|nr:aldehyde oxidase 3-like protein [Camelus ferus]